MIIRCLDDLTGISLLLLSKDNFVVGGKLISFDVQYTEEDYRQSTFHITFRFTV